MNQNQVAANFVVNLIATTAGAGATAVSGGNVVFGAAVNVFAVSLLDGLMKDYTGDTGLKTKITEIKARHASNEVKTLREILEEVLVVAGPAKPAIEELAEAIEDLDSAERNARLLEAAKQVFIKIDKTTESIEEVNERLVEHERRIATLEVKVETTAKSSGSLHGEIDQAKSLIHSNPDIALDRLTELLKRYADRLDPRGHFRILANMGHAYVAKRDLPTAAEHFIESANHQEGTEDGTAHKAYGYLLQGDLRRANSLVREMIQKSVRNKLAWFTWLSTVSKKDPVEDLIESMPHSIKDDADCARVISWHAFDQGKFTTAEQFARIAVRDGDKIAEAHQWLGTVLMESEKATAILLDNALPKYKNPERIEEAESEFTRAIELSGGNEVKANAYICRHLCRIFLDKVDDAKDDLRHARVYAENMPGVRYQYAIQLWEEKNYDTAIDELQAIPEDEQPKQIQYVLARILLERNKDGDIDQAREYLSEYVSHKSITKDSLYYESIRLLSKAIARSPSTGGIEENELLKYLKEDPDSTIAYTFLSSYFNSIDDNDKAKEYADKAYQSIDKESSDELIRCLATLLDKLKKHSEAFALLKEIIPPDIDSMDARRLVDCALNAGEDKFVMQYCAKLRENGIYNSFCIHAETDRHRKYSIFNDAISALSDGIENAPLDSTRRFCAMLHSLTGIEADNKDWIITDKTKLPLPSNSSPSIGKCVVAILARDDDQLAAPEYAYELLRRNFESPDAHMAMVGAMQLCSNRKIEFPTSDTIQPGVGFHYIDKSSKKKSFLIVEDSIEPEAQRIQRNELAATSDEAKIYIGRKRDDEVVAGQGSTITFKHLIQSVESKYITRSRDSWENWTSRFTNIPFVEPHCVKDEVTGEYNFDPIFAVLDADAHRSDKIVESFKNNHLSSTHFAVMSHKPIGESIQFLASRDDLGIRSCSGNAKEFVHGIESYRAADRFILDASTLWTLHQIGGSDLLHHLPHDLLVSSGTIQDFILAHSKLREAPRDGGTFAKFGDRYRLIEHNPSTIDSKLNRLKRFIDFIRDRAHIIPGTALAEDTALQNRLSELVPTITAETIAISIAENATLWTDDSAIARVAFMVGCKHRIWTQVGLEGAFDEKYIDTWLHKEMTCSLVINNVKFTSVSTDVFRYAIENSNWNYQTSPLAAMIRYVGSQDIESNGLIVLVASVMPFVWDVPDYEKSKSITVALLDSLANRSDANYIIYDLYRGIRHFFPSYGWRMTRMHQSRSCIVEWAESRPDVFPAQSNTSKTKRTG